MNNNNPFIPPQRRTAVLTLEGGFKVRAEITMPATDRGTWHTDLERRLVRELNRAQPHAVHKVVKIHLLRN